MRVLLTTDVVGGVWTYTEEVAAGLDRLGHEVHLVSFGGEPRPDQLHWLDGHPTVGFTPLPYPLEWMPDPEPGLGDSVAALREVSDRYRPDVIHLNQYFPAGADLGAPKLMVAHSDVVSWWREVKREVPPDDHWFRRYRSWVENGLAGADLRAAPTRWMATQIRAIYGCGPVLVVHNGRSRSGDVRLRPDDAEPIVLTAGRLWDEGKGARDLAGAAAKLAPHAAVVAVGPIEHPAGGDDFPAHTPGLSCRGLLPQQEVADLLAIATIYVGTSRYEPFGLAPLEAAIAGSALVLTDIPTFRELWEGAALFYPPGDTSALADAVLRLLRDGELRRRLIEESSERASTLYSADSMVRGYEELYGHLLAGRAAAATGYEPR